ncbi:alcohol dehydrogenase catalytic domain-containing protein, partial [Agrobacterium tumefaciens]|nr:D-arabinose 1-dehydrogenase-like Zn-dependent alcohol dehydrogenase [Agrobacterium tumefaciens]
MAIARGYAATDASKPLTPFTFERREPNDDDVVIDIKYAGICHSDIHTVRNEWKNAVFPIVPGHEIAGVVKAVGSKVTKFKVGDHVGVGCFVDSCVGCATRDLDNEHYMPGLVQTYNDVDPNTKTATHGGYSDSIVVKEGYVLSIPDNLPLDASAPLLCAGITLYSPLRRWNAGPGQK